MGSKDIDVQMIYLFVNQFDAFVSFVLQDKDILKEDMEEYLTNILKDNRGKSGKNNNQTEAAEGDIPMGVPLETTTSESVATLDWREKSGNIDWGKEE